MGKRRRLDLRKTLFLLPNMITLSSIFCGFDSIRISASATKEDDYYLAALLIVFAMFFDILDGRVARATKTQSAFGLQIDSLADVVSFGLLNAVHLGGVGPGGSSVRIPRASLLLAALAVVVAPAATGAAGATTARSDGPQPYFAPPFRSHCTVHRYGDVETSGVSTSVNSTLL